MGVRDDGFDGVNNFKSLLCKAACPFVVLGVLQILADGDLIEHRAVSDGADHAEEVVPVLRVTVWAEAAVVVVGEDGFAIGARDLAGKCGSEIGACEAGLDDFC